MKRSWIFMILLLIGTAVIVACGGGSEPEVEVGEGQASIDVLMNDIYYGETNDNVANPPTWTVKTNQLVVVNADNQGVLEHNWAIVEAGAELPDTIADPASVEDLILFDIGDVGGGDTYTSPFNSPVPGEYQVICTVAGHYPAMQGTLIVEE